MSTDDAVQQATWIFQANPAHYNIAQSLSNEGTELWNCMQHAAKIKTGDRVLIWISGKQAGIYAVGEVLTDPVGRQDTERGQGYWKSGGGKMLRPRVQVKYHRVLLDRPLLRQLLMWDPALGNLKVLVQPRGTNFSVTPEEWAALESWIGA